MYRVRKRKIIHFKLNSERFMIQWNDELIKETIINLEVKEWYIFLTFASRFQNLQWVVSIYF